MSDEFNLLKLENQLCFPLYACSKEVVRRYRPILDELDLTYTQYITMMVLWDRHTVNVSELGNCLYLDSGTMTPLLKKLEAKGLIERKRDPKDERNVYVSLTEEGEELKYRAKSVPEQIGSCINLSPQEAATLYGILYKILGELTNGSQQ